MRAGSHGDVTFLRLEEGHFTLRDTPLRSGITSESQRRLLIEGTQPILRQLHLPKLGGRARILSVHVSSRIRMIDMNKVLIIHNFVH